MHTKEVLSHRAVAPPLTILPCSSVLMMRQALLTFPGSSQTWIPASASQVAETTELLHQAWLSSWGIFWWDSWRLLSGLQGPPYLQLAVGVLLLFGLWLTSLGWL